MDTAMSNADTPAIHLRQSGDLPLLYIRNRHASAVIALQGAQVLRYQRHDSRPLLWLSDLAAYQRGQSMRGGIPVCWPWFGDLARNPLSIQTQFASDNVSTHELKAPAHGLVRGITWLLDTVSENTDATVVTLRCPTAAIGLGHIELQLQISIGDTLQTQLQTSNHSKADFVYSQALHTYFAISDIHTTVVHGLENSRYIETLENWSEKKQDGAIAFTGETDRIYLDTPSRVDIVDRNWQRNITLHAEGSCSAVVWNPWIEKSKRLSQFDVDAWQQMLCIESANVMEDCIRLAPGAQHTLALMIGEKPTS